MRPKKRLSAPGGQHYPRGPKTGEGLLGKAGTSSVRHPEPVAETIEFRGAAPADRARSARTDFTELKWKLKPEVEICNPRDSEKPLWLLRAESWRLDARGMLLRLWLPTVEWLKYLLTNTVTLKVRIAMPALGANVCTVAHVAWAEQLADPSDGVTIGVTFDALNVVDRDRLLRFSSSLKSTARGLP